MNGRLSAALISLLLLALTACSSMDSRTRKLQLGMSRAQVVKILGSDYTVAGAKKDGEGSALEVLRFGEKKDPGLFLYFNNDQLVQWGDNQVIQNMPGAN